MSKLTKKHRIDGDILGHVRLILLALAICLCSGVSGLIEDKRYRQRETPMHKVQLTQKGYIQFLRWELPVPEITEFTFCLWIESADLTYPHSIFSYSKNERDRLVRSWISCQGKSIHLEIGGKQVFSATTELQENRWYHVCVSWENQHGRHALWINGQLWSQGRSSETIGHRVPSNGDIVLGQEYTDFDKGLEEGIEGSVLGFNLLLASAFNALNNGNRSKTAMETSRDSVRLPSKSNYATVPLFPSIPSRMAQPVDVPREPVTVKMRTRARRPFPSISSRFRGRRHARHGWWSSTIDRVRTKRDDDPWLSLLEKEPYGMQLVKLTYVHCEIGRGSPPIGGPLMLISWTRTPVRVFGGATLKNVNNDCGNF